ncbi:MAG: hypothetical protein JW829_14355 [Pirellulales bacterium]|nr:hypothetical protein [Pirellulales bacterium]
MNLVGKICVCLILIISLGFMFLSMAVYATHKNWREDAEQLKSQLDDRKTENERLVERRNRIERQLRIEQEIATQELIKVKGERDALIAENNSMRQDLDTTRLTQRDAIEAAKATQANNSQIIKELEGLRAEIRKEQSDRDSAFAAAKKATDAMHQKFNELIMAEERKQMLVEKVAEYSNWLASLGHDPNRPPDAIVPRVKGEVLVVRQLNADQLIEISIGSDDGLLRGHTVEVYRGNRYLGRAEIRDTEPDKSIGRIIPRTLNGRIEVGDRVATKLRVG